MKKAYLLLGISVCSLLAAGAAYSAGHMQQGLWRVSNEADFEIPPQVLAQMKAAGMTPPGQGQPMVSQVCVSAAQAAMETPPIIETRESGCAVQNVRSTGNQTSADVVCTGRTKGQGHMEVNYSGMTHYQAQYHFEGITQGRPQTLNMSFTGDFVSPNCGSIKPIQ